MFEIGGLFIIGRIYDVKFLREVSNIDWRQIVMHSVKYLASSTNNLRSDANIWCLLSIFVVNYNHNIAIKNEHFDSKSQYLMSAVKIFDVWHQLLMPGVKFLMQ